MSLKYFPQNIIYHNYKLLFPLEDNQRIQILEYKQWIFESWNSCLRSSWHFFKQTLESLFLLLSRLSTLFFYFGIFWCWFCRLRHQKSRAFCVIFTSLLAHTDSLWHRCRNISGLEWFCCFHYCHIKARIFSLLQVVHVIKSKRRKTFRIIENSKWQFQHSSLFFPAGVGRQFLHVTGMCRYTIFTCV